jgi:hypothetical protein
MGVLKVFTSPLAPGRERSRGDERVRGESYVVIALSMP